MLGMHRAGEWNGSTYPILLKVGVVANDGGCIGALLLPDLVGGAVGLKVAEVVGGSVVRGIVLAHCDRKLVSLCPLGIMTSLVLTGLDDIILYQRVRRPSV
jgi:hypothetical protein